MSKKVENKNGCRECESKQKLLDYFHSLLVQDTLKHLKDRVARQSK